MIASHKAQGIQLQTAWSQGLAVLLLIVILFADLLGNRADPDLWGYLAFGRLFWETGQFPARDIFSYVATKDVWIYHEWLTGIILYPVYVWSGGVGLQWLKIILALATVGLVGLTARLRGADFWSIAFLIFITKGFLTMGYSPVRAQVFTYGFFALTLFILESSKQSQVWQRLLWIIPIQILWCNFHGGFLAGIGLIGIYAIGEALARRSFWPYLLALVLAGLATIVNPYGPEYWEFIGHATLLPRPEITEWMSLVTAYRRGLYLGDIFYFLTLSLFTVLVLWWAKWRDITGVLVLAVTWYLGFSHMRHQVFFFLAMGVFLPEPMGQLLKWLGKIDVVASIRRLDCRWLVIIYIIFLGAASIKVFQGLPIRLTVPAQPGTQEQLHYPVGAVAHILANNISGKLVSEFTWGEYLLWTLYPQCRVAVDGRYETVFPETVMQQFWDFSRAKPDWERFITNYPPDIILLMPHKKIYGLIKADPAWKLIYEDQVCGLFIRDE